MNKEILARLKRLDACSPAIEWAATQPDRETAWQNCTHGGWMAWIIHRVGANGEPWSEERKPFVLAMCKCARLVQKYVPKNEKWSMECIQMHETWACGEATVEQCQIVMEAAKAAGWAAEAAEAAGWAAKAARWAARWAAEAAGWAAKAAGAAGVAGAAEAAEAAGAAGWAAEAAEAAGWAAEAARTKILSQCADIVREYYPDPPELKRKTKNIKKPNG